MHERLRLLRDGIRDAAWLDGLEETMAAEGAAVSAARLVTIEKLNGELSARGAEGAFPCAHLALTGRCRRQRGRARRPCRPPLRRRARAMPKPVARTRDRISPISTCATRTKRADARDCSTGEQKALLISIVLANAWLQRKRRDGVAPVLLLDEIAAHLDATRRAALFEEILALNGAGVAVGDRQVAVRAAAAARAVFRRCRAAVS